MWRPILLHVDLFAPPQAFRLVPSSGSRFPDTVDPTVKDLSYGGSWLNVTRPCVEACDLDATCQAWTRMRPDGHKGNLSKNNSLTCKLFSQVGRHVLEAREASLFVSGFKDPFQSIAPGPVREASAPRRRVAKM